MPAGPGEEGHGGEEEIPEGPKSVMGIFHIESGKVVTCQDMGAMTYPKWTGEGKVKKATWMDLETMEVLCSLDFHRHG